MVLLLTIRAEFLKCLLMAFVGVEPSPVAHQQINNSVATTMLCRSAAFLAFLNSLAGCAGGAAPLRGLIGPFWDSIKTNAA